MATNPQPQPPADLESMAQAKFSPLSEAETRLLRAAYESLVRQLDAGLVGDDQIILALRNLISAEQATIGARIDNREAETALLYAQGIIANVLPGQLAVSALDQHRLTLLADAGYLRYFGTEKAGKKK